MKEYTIKRMNADGDWSQIDTLAIDVSYLDSPDFYAAWAQIAYDDEALHVHLFCKEPATRAVEHGPLGSPCEDCCLEFFFSPMEGDPRYFNIELNRNGCMYLGLASSLPTLVRLIPEKDGDLLHPVFRDLADGWEVFYTFPYEFVRRFFPDFKVYAGKKIRANCFKCADLTEPPHYFSWSPITGEKLSYHKPECFGSMIFSE